MYNACVVLYPLCRNLVNSVVFLNIQMLKRIMGTFSYIIWYRFTPTGTSSELCMGRIGNFYLRLSLNVANSHRLGTYFIKAVLFRHKWTSVISVTIFNFRNSCISVDASDIIWSGIKPVQKFLNGLNTIPFKSYRLHTKLRIYYRLVCSFYRVQTEVEFFRNRR